MSILEIKPFVNDSLTQSNASLNGSFSLSEPDKYLFKSLTVTILIACTTTLMSFATIIGNVLVISAFFVDKSLRTYSNYFILNLSIADLFIGILIPPYIPFLLYNYTWYLGRIPCIIWLVFDYVVGSASVLCIVAISLDRYLLVTKGLSYLSHQKFYKTLFIMLSVWVIAFLNYGPAIIIWELIEYDSNSKDCHVGFHDNTVYLLISAFVEFFFPFVSICGLNLAVYLSIRKRSRGISRNNRLGNSKSKIDQMAETIRKSKSSIPLRTNETRILNSQDPVRKISADVESADTEGRPSKTRLFSRVSATIEHNTIQITGFQFRTLSLKKDKKTAHFLFIIVLTFACCWAPYTILTLIKSVCKTCIDDMHYELAFWLLWFNSTLNPILYPFLHVKFRKAFLKIFAKVKQWFLKFICLRRI